MGVYLSFFVLSLFFLHVCPLTLGDPRWAVTLSVIFSPHGHSAPPRDQLNNNISMPIFACSLMQWRLGFLREMLAGKATILWPEPFLRDTLRRCTGHACSVRK